MISLPVLGLRWVTLWLHAGVCCRTALPHDGPAPPPLISIESRESFCARSFFLAYVWLWNYRNWPSRESEGIRLLDNESHCRPAKSWSLGQGPRVSKTPQQYGSRNIQVYGRLWASSRNLDWFCSWLGLACMFSLRHREIFWRVKKCSRPRFIKLRLFLRKLARAKSRTGYQVPIPKSLYSLLQTEFSNFPWCPANLCTMLSKCNWNLRGYEADIFTF